MSKSFVNAAILASLAALGSAETGLQRGRQESPLKRKMREMVEGECLFIVDPNLTAEDVAAFKAIPSKNAEEKAGTKYGSFEGTVRPILGNPPVRTKDKAGVESVSHQYGLDENGKAKYFRNQILRLGIGVIGEAMLNQGVNPVCFDLGGNEVEYNPDHIGVFVWRADPSERKLRQRNAKGEIAADDNAVTEMPG